MNAIIMCILKYVKSAPAKEILFTKCTDPLVLNVYTDVDCAGVIDDRRSTSGHFTFCGRKSCYMEKQKIKCCCSLKCGGEIQRNDT